MNIVKSMHAGLLYRTFSYHRQPVFVASTLWGFSLASGEPVLEQDLWKSIGKTLANDQVFDSGMPKDHAEFLAYGSFFSPGGQPVKGGKVSITLGMITKVLSVQGDRSWVKVAGGALAIKDPQPFTEMPITYAQAFGGEGYQKNPVGKGYRPVQTELGEVFPLPNVEYINQWVGSPGDRPDPASFAALDTTWEQRMSKSGTYDEAYIAKRMPGFPDDIHWDFFNDAAADQWFPHYLHGDEPYIILNMNPEMSRLEGCLPGVCGRVFVNQDIEGSRVFKEIPTKLDTVVFFPAEKLGILIYRGTIKVREEDGTDIKQLLVAHEGSRETPKTSEFYQNELKLRTDPEEGFKYMLYTAPLIPEGCRCGFEVLQEGSDFHLEMLTQKNMDQFFANKEKEIEQTIEEKKQEITELLDEQKKEIEKKLEGTDIDPERFTKNMNVPFDQVDREKAASELTEKLHAFMEAVVPGITTHPEKLDFTRLDLKKMEELPQFIQGIIGEKINETRQAVKQQLEPLKEKMGEGMKELDAVKQSMGGDKADEMISGMKEKLSIIEEIDAMFDQSQQTPALPRTSIFNEDLNRIEAELEKNLDAAKTEISKVQHSDIPEKTREQLDLDRLDFREDDIRSAIEGFKEAIRKLEPSVREQYLLGAHLIEEGRSPHEGREPEIAAALLTAYKRGEETKDGDYAYVDLSNQDLSGIDLSGAYLEYADLTNTNFSGADLSNAVLAHARLINTSFTGTNLRGANIGATLIDGAQFIEADLSGATLGKARIINSRFHRCTLIERMDMFLETTFHKVDFSDSVLPKTNFIDKDFSDCCFDGADLSESNFIHPILNRASFMGARLDTVNFVEARGERICFDEASMRNSRFVGGCDLKGAHFIRADVSDANLRDCHLEQADFTQAKLSKSDLSGANLRRASFEKADAFQAQFIKSDLSFANLKRINLMEGSFMNARLVGANLKGANLYSVSFMNVTLGETQFTDAILEKTLLKDWRPL